MLGWGVYVDHSDHRWNLCLLHPRQWRVEVCTHCSHTFTECTVTVTLFAFVYLCVVMSDASIFVSTYVGVGAWYIRVTLEWRKIPLIVHMAISIRSLFSQDILGPSCLAT